MNTAGLDVKRPVPALQLVGRAFYLLALLVTLASGGCGRVQPGVANTDDGFLITMTTMPSPPTVGEGMVVISAKDASGQPITGAKVEVEGNMSHAGMQPSVGKTDSGEGGIYRVRLTWTMGGDWYVDLKLTMSDGKVATRRFPVTIR